MKIKMMLTLSAMLILCNTGKAETDCTEVPVGEELVCSAGAFLIDEDTGEQIDTSVCYKEIQYELICSSDVPACTSLPEAEGISDVGDNQHSINYYYRNDFIEYCGVERTQDEALTEINSALRELKDDCEGNDGNFQHWPTLDFAEAGRFLENTFCEMPTPNDDEPDSEEEHASEESSEDDELLLEPQIEYIYCD